MIQALLFAFFWHDSKMNQLGTAMDWKEEARDAWGILMGAFFKTKRRCRSYRAGPMSVQTGWTSAWVTDAELMTIHCQMEQPGPQERLAVVVLIYGVSLA